MIQSIRGRVSGQRGRILYIERQGIEWAVELSQQSLEEITASEGEVRVFTHLYHREDRMYLYGFSTEEERDIFLELIKIAGIGPSQALRILSGLRKEEFLRCLEAEDAEALSGIPGVGRKTAGKIILGMRGKLAAEPRGAAPQDYPDLLEALSDMGFDRKKAEAALQELAKTLPGDDNATVSEREHELFRAAIVYLSSH
jgi:Holliday junction DNA helicase RuvA